jgi:hypothetical protein
LDFLALANNFGKEGADWAEGDFDSNGAVNFLDFLTLADNFGATTAEPVASAVGKPSGLISAAAVDDLYTSDSNDDEDEDELGLRD